MGNILTLETSKYEIRLDNFEGPLDLLCHLVEKNKMDINEVNITKITDQYRIHKCNARIKFRYYKRICFNGFKLIIYKIKKLITKTSRR